MSRSLLVVLVSILLAAPALAQHDRLDFDATTHDFGTIQQGDEARHTFVFRNTGEAPLRLTNVTPSCGCTTPHWTRQSIAPGDTGHVAAVFDSEDRAGPFTKTIRVKASDEIEPVTLTIRGRVQPPPLEGGTQLGGLLFEEHTVDLGAISAGQRGRTTVRIQNVAERPIRFTNVETPSNMVSAYAPDDPLFAGDLDEITVLVRAYGMTAGDSFSYPITLVTDDESQQEKTLRVVGRVAE